MYVPCGAVKALLAGNALTTTTTTTKKKDLRSGNEKKGKKEALRVAIHPPPHPSPSPYGVTLRAPSSFFCLVSESFGE